MRRGSFVAALVAAFALALAGCGSSTPAIGAQLAGPTDVVPFVGVTVNSPTPRQYLAVSSGRGNELRIIDLVTDKAVLGPSVVFPLSIPSVPRPVRLGAASLGDGGADVLVASSAGSAAIELVSTWSAENRVVDVYDLRVEAAGVGAAPEVLSLVAAPVPGVAGQARLIASLSGGQLVVVTALRQPDGSIALARPAAVRDLGFDAVDLSVATSVAPATQGLWLFAATPEDLDPDPVNQLFGVAQIDIGGDPSTWAPIALDARAPTRLVAAADVAERVTGEQRPDAFLPESPLRVYAALDPAGCGRDFRMNCGLATLDPLTRTLAADPAGELDHRAPMPISGVPLDIVISQQPANPAPEVCNDLWDPTDPDIEEPLYPNARLLIAPGTGQRCTSAIATVTSSDGFVYIYDLGRWSAPNDQSILRSSSRVRATSVTEIRPPVDPATDTAPLLAFWEGDDPDSKLTEVQSDLSKWFKVTPGYTPTERFHIGFKIPMPPFVTRGGIIGRLPDGTVYLAAQAQAGSDGAGAPIWAVGPRLSDPSNGVRPGDTVALATLADATCAPENGVFPQTTIAAVLPPDPALFPGGAIALTPLTDAGGQPVTSCWETATASGNVAEVSFSVRSSGLLIYGEALGYLGRPEKDVRFNAAWQNEDNPALSAEQRAVARKLRRFYYPGAEKCDADTVCPDLGTVNPLTPGPAISFRVGYLGKDGQPVVGPTPEPVTGEQLIVTTQSGIYPMTRKPTGSGALPIGIARVDRSAFVGPGNIVRFYVAYQDDQVFVFSPGQSVTQVFSVR